MVLSIIMGLVCIALIVLLYIFSGGWKTYGGVSGLWKWLSQGGLSNPSIHKKQNLSSGKYRSDDVADVLEDIYREFTERVNMQNEELKKMNESLLLMRSMVVSIEERITILENANNGKPLIINSALEDHNLIALEQLQLEDEPVYFKILDELRKGSSVEQVAMQLGIPVLEVEKVLRLMDTPSS